MANRKKYMGQFIHLEADIVTQLSLFSKLQISPLYSFGVIYFPCNALYSWASQEHNFLTAHQN
jgi:hypothetical protein